MACHQQLISATVLSQINLAKGNQLESERFTLLLSIVEQILRLKKGNLCFATSDTLMKKSTKSCELANWPSL